MASTRLGYLAVKKETTTSTAVKPTHFLRFKGGDIKYAQDIVKNNPIASNRWNPLVAVPGKITTDGDLEFDLDSNECVYWFHVALGSISSADISSLTDASAFRHTITLANTLPALTVEQGKGNLDDTSSNRQNYEVARAFGVMVDKLTITGGEDVIMLKASVKAHGIFLRGKLTADATAGASVALHLDTVEGLVATDDTVNIYDTTPQSEMDAIAALSSTAKTITIATLGNSYTVAKDAKAELVPLTPSYSTAPQIMSFYNAQFQFGVDLTAAASAAIEDVQNWEIVYDNQLTALYGSLRASPSVLAPKGASCSIKFKKYFRSVVDRDRYLAQTAQACIVTITNNNIISATDTNQAPHKIKIEFSSLQFTSYEMPTGVDDLYLIQVEATAFYNTTDGRAIRVLVDNAKAGTQYTA